jgi:putative ABC transport system permease protein
LWVSPPGAYNLLRTSPFQATEQSRLAALPGVSAVRLYRGGLLDWGERKVWVIAPPREASPLMAPSQMVEGSLATADAELRAGGWAVLSQALAQEHHLHIGDRVTLPSPVPTTVRVAALSTNIGWAPGAVILSAEEYARAWGNEDPSAYNVLLRPGARAAQAALAIERALGPSSGLSVQSAAAHAEEQNALTRQGLQRLNQIATLILIVAVLAMAAAIGTMVWQRRPRLAKLKLEGFAPGALWRTIVLESVLLVAVGALSGGLLGLLGQRLLDQALTRVINYPVVVSVALESALVSVAIVVVAVVAILAASGRFAVRVSAATAMEE